MLPKQRDYDKKIFRLMSILNKLNSRKVVYSSELADEFNVSLRTVQRDIELLNMVGFPLVALDRGQHSFQEGFSLKQMRISNEEASLLSFLYEIAKSLGGRFESSFRTILKKVMHKGYDSPFYVKLPEGVRLDKSMPFVKNIESAINQSKKIEIGYCVLNKKQKQYRINPLKIIFFDGFWYLLAQTEKNKHILKFRLDRIKDVSSLGEYFEALKNIKTILDKSVNIWFPEKRDKKITLKVAKEVAHFFKRKVYFPLQKIKRDNKDGSLIIECKISKYEEIMHVILHWIPHLIIIKPKNFQERIKEVVREYEKKIE